VNLTKTVIEQCVQVSKLFVDDVPEIVFNMHRQSAPCFRPTVSHHSSQLQEKR